MILIPLSEALKEMDSGNPFSIVFVTCDRRRKKAGDIIEVPNATLSATAIDHDTSPSFPSSRPANQYTNATRNILIHPSGQVRKVHIRLITRFNGKKVHY